MPSFPAFQKEWDINGYLKTNDFLYFSKKLVEQIKIFVKSIYDLRAIQFKSITMHCKRLTNSFFNVILHHENEIQVKDK